MRGRRAVDRCTPQPRRSALGHRWGATAGTIGFHGGKVAVRRPRVRSYDGHEVALPSWTAAQGEDWLGRWAMNLMLINVSTRKFRRAVRLPEGDLPAVAGDGTSKSAASRRFVALSAERMAEWMASDLSQLDLLVIQIDGLHIGNDLILVAALGIDADGNKHPLGLIEGATENAAVVQALIDNLIERGLDPKVLPAVHRRRRQGAEQGRSARPSAGIRRSSAVRFTKPATSSSACPSRCTPRCARRCDKRGSSTTRTRPSGCCAISLAGSSKRRPA